MTFRKASPAFRRNEKHKLYRKKSRSKTYLLRGLLILITLILLLAGAVFSAAAVVAHGPSETMRNTLVLSAMQASATKWVPGLFLDRKTVDDIVQNSANVKEQTFSMKDYGVTVGDYSHETGSDPTVPSEPAETDEWANAVDGMKLITFNASTFKGYVLLVKDPSRVYVAVSSDFTDPEVEGVDIFTMASREKCVAAVNGGEFNDPGGTGTGNNPIGLTYSRGSCAWDEYTAKTFIGIDKNNVLRVYDRLSRQQAEKAGIRDGVCFQTTAAESVLISNDGENITLHRAPDNTAVSQRTAIGQRADGTIIFLVTDGRTAASLGATYDDVIDVMVSYGAVTAAMLDGGSSSMLYYRDFWNAYPSEYNYDSLDRFGKKGLVNIYKAFTLPRQIPTFFAVSPAKN